MEDRRNRSNPSLLVGLDVGGTKIDAMVVDCDEDVRGVVQLPTQTATPEDVVESVETAIRRVLDRASAGPEVVSAIGIGIPGQVQDGRVDLAVNLALEDYPLRAAVESAFGVPVVLENDVRAAAIGAYEYFRTREPVESLIYLSVGTGISAGVVLDGSLRRGVNNMAGEIGHVVVAPDGARCNCGSVGCLETVASGPALVRLAAEAIEAGAETLLRNASPLDAPAVYQAARDGDALARDVIRTAAVYLSQAIQWLVLAYDLDKVVIGGGVSHEGDDFLRPILAELSRTQPTSRLKRVLFPETKIVLQPPEMRAGVRGAIALARRTSEQVSTIQRREAAYTGTDSTAGH